MIRRRGRLLVAAIVMTFVPMRAYLYFAPNTDLNIGPYNIHHLYTGLLLIALCGVPAVLSSRDSRASDLAVAGFGVGLSLALDEWVYLLATDGSNAAYLTPVSFWGAVVLLAAVCAYILWLSRLQGSE